MKWAANEVVKVGARCCSVAAGIPRASTERPGGQASWERIAEIALVASITLVKVDARRDHNHVRAAIDMRIGRFDLAL